MHFDERELDRQLARVSLEVEPPAHLWLGVIHALGASSRRMRPVLMAACIAAAAACVAAIFTWAVVRKASAPDGLAVVASNQVFAEPSDRRYVAALGSLRHTFGERVAALDPRTRSKIEASLAVIRQAHEDIRQALLASPQNALLQELWQSTLRDEIDLYDQVVVATQPVVRS